MSLLMGPGLVGAPGLCPHFCLTMSLAPHKWLAICLAPLSACRVSRSPWYPLAHRVCLNHLGIWDLAEQRLYECLLDGEVQFLLGFSSPPPPSYPFLCVGWSLATRKEHPSLRGGLDRLGGHVLVQGEQGLSERKVGRRGLCGVWLLPELGQERLCW